MSQSDPRLAAATSITDTADDLRLEAEQFIRQCYTELGRAEQIGPRLRAVAAQIDAGGCYEHTVDELEYGARVAWRNASRCIGRLYWRSLSVVDCRQERTPEGIAQACVQHLRRATNGGRLRPLITVFAPDRPGDPGPRIRNDQLVRYAGYRRPSRADGPRSEDVVGDRQNLALTDAARALGWSGPGTAFDVLPLIIDTAGRPPHLAQLPPDAVAEVPLSHPVYGWFVDLGLRWHAVPAVSDMCLEIGGLHYQCAPFSGWYMGTEIGARNLADTDRYDMLPAVAAGLGLDTSSDRTLWRDRALVELNRAVLHSFDTAGVTIADHHTESQRFLIHREREQAAGRVCPADWAWVVPPISGSATAVFHHLYENISLMPGFTRHERYAVGTRVPC